jgi:hypothetical protein
MRQTPYFFELGHLPHIFYLASTYGGKEGVLSRKYCDPGDCCDHRWFIYQDLIFLNRHGAKANLQFCAAGCKASEYPHEAIAGQ